MLEMEPHNVEEQDNSQQQQQVAAPTATSSSSPPESPHAGGALLSLDEDVFHCVCVFIPVDDLLLRLATVSHAVRRRVWANHELWQQLWLRYLVQFFRSLIPPPPRPVKACTSPCASPWPAGVVDTASMADAIACSNAAWRLYHYHRSKEPRPRVELLERLTVSPEDISDLPTAETPHTTTHLRPSPSGVLQGGGKAQDQLLLFAQLCATQLVANNLTHVAAASPTSTGSPEQRSTSIPAATTVATDSAKKKKSRTTTSTFATAAVARRRERQVDRLRRALHFLLSADGQRPAFQDRLWTTTYEAGEAYQREILKDSIDVSLSRRQHRTSAKPPPHAEKDRLRPLSWLDDRDHSVKVLLFDDNSRAVGDAGAVQAERIKLLASVAQHWRLAYAHQFYLTPTDGKEHGGSHPSPSGLPRPRRVAPGGRDRNSPAAVTQTGLLPDLQQEDQQQQQSGRVSWEQIYRRFRDDNASGRTARIRQSLQRVVVTGAGGRTDGEGGMSGSAHEAASAAAAHAIPSSGNPLFDLHLLTFSKRKQFYAAMLSSTVEVPDGMGAFFATCVSESFLRWWCWRNRRLHEVAVGLSTSDAWDNRTASSASPAPSSRALTFPSLPSAYGGVPTTLWIARVCSVHKPQYGTTASDGSFGRPGPIEAEESIVYSSSYSDATSSTDTLASASSSIDFVEEVPEPTLLSPRPARSGGIGAGEEGVDAFQSYPEIGMDSNGGSHPPHEAEQPPPQPPQHPSPSPPQFSRPSAPRVALLFPLPHMLAYWFMMHHVTFYSYQVYRRMWGDQEITIAVCSRILSPTGHSVECRLFYTLRCAAFPRMYTKMMFTPGTLPALTLQDKMSARSPYRSPSTTSASTSTSSSSSADSPRRPPFPLPFPTNRRDSDSDSSEEPTHRVPPPFTQQQQPAPAAPELSSTSSEPRRGRRTALDTQPVDSRQVYDLFWTGFGRVEVESGPTIARSNLVRLRVSLGLPVDFPIGLLWNVLMFASGVGPLILKDHRHSLYFNYSKSFTDVVEEEFGEVGCYGYGARPATPTVDRPMPNPLDAEVALMREQRNLDEAARALVWGLAAAAVHPATDSNNINSNPDDNEGRDAAQDTADADAEVNASFSTAEPGEDTEEEEDDNHPARLANSPTSSFTTSTTTYGSWDIDSEFSSAGGRSSWRELRSPYSDSL